MTKLRLAGAALVVALSVAACGAPTTSTTPQSPTTAPATNAPATSVPATSVPATSAPATSVPATTAPAPAAAATVAARPAADPQGVTFVIDSAASQASYHARETLAGRSLPSEAVGTTRKVSGTIVLDGNGSPVADRSTITVDLSSLQSDESRRDNFIKGNTLNTNRFPTATFVPKSTDGLPSPLPTSGSATFQLTGDLTVRGVTRPVTWQVAANFADAAMTGNATTRVQITDFGMTPPKAGPVLSIEDELTLELDFAATREA
jgi:polyisoprenoid-binding protein YceI